MIVYSPFKANQCMLLCILHACQGAHQTKRDAGNIIGDMYRGNEKTLIILILNMSAIEYNYNTAIMSARISSMYYIVR